MNDKSELQKLIIRNLSILETAPSVVAEIEKHIFDAINAKIEKWVLRKKSWEGVYKYPTGETSFKALDWPKTAEKDYAAYISLGCENTTGYQYCLSPLLGVLPEKFGLWLYVDTRTITGMNGKGTQPSKAWGTFLSDWYSTSKLPELGIDLLNQNLFLPVVIYVDKLIETYPDSISEALVPVDDALETLRQAIPELNRLLTDAGTKFVATVA